MSTRERRPPGRPRIAGNEAATEIIQALARAAPDLPATSTTAEAVRGLMAWLGCSRRTGYRILERATWDGVITLCDGGKAVEGEPSGVVGDLRQILRS